MGIFWFVGFGLIIVVNLMFGICLIVVMCCCFIRFVLIIISLIVFFICFLFVNYRVMLVN